MITVHNHNTGNHTYPDVDSLVLSTCEWYDENNGECQMDVQIDEKMISMQFAHFGFSDGDTSAVILIDDLPDCIDPEDLYEQLKACC